MRGVTLVVWGLLALAVPKTVSGQSRDTVYLPVRSQQTVILAKDGGTATLLSILLPGGGQFYTDRPGKGAAILGAYVVGAAAGLASYKAGSCSSGNLGGYSYTLCSKDETAGLYAGLAVAGVAWLYGAFTASGDADSWNSSRGIRVVPSPSGAGLGLSFAF